MSAALTFGLSPPPLHNSELKRRMKAEKKAAEKEGKVKEQEDKESNNTVAQNACADEETLDPNVRLYFFFSLFIIYYS